ncbi:UNVERIFIED_CONTAM: hypothetical protein Scaly_3128500 [Sesamum calycinum]|uniref:Uncharacterized protein n=1 Tax=Sesamum calycinum TaxID=2727403 RepID=A0AAW2JI70_9LAMI
MYNIKGSPSFGGIKTGLLVSEDIEIILREKVALCHELDSNQHLWATSGRSLDLSIVQVLKAPFGYGHNYHIRQGLEASYQRLSARTGLVDLSRTLTAGVGLGLRTVRGTSFCLIQLGPKTGGSLGEMGKASSYRRGGDSLLLHKLIPHKKTDPVALAFRVLSIPSHSIPGYAAPRPESPRPPFSARNPRSWLCQHNIRAVPFILLCGPRPGPAFWEARSHRAHGPAGLPSGSGNSPVPWSKTWLDADLLHEERTDVDDIITTSLFIPLGMLNATLALPALSCLSVWSALGVSEQRSLHPFALVHPKFLTLMHELLNKPSSYQAISCRLVGKVRASSPISGGASPTQAPPDEGGRESYRPKSFDPSLNGGGHLIFSFRRCSFPLGRSVWPFLLRARSRFADLSRVQGYLCRQLKIRHPNSAPYRPQQMNGAVEAEKKKIKNKNILLEIAITYRDWHEMLPFALHAYRTSVRTSTGATPYSIVYGMEAVLPLEMKYLF